MKKNRLLLQRFLGLIGVAWIVLAMIINIVVPDQSMSSIENRSLQTFPSVSVQSILNGDFESKISDWFSDQFVGRNWNIRIHYAILKCLGYQKIDSVYLCNQKLIEENAQVNEESLEKNLKAINTFFQNHSDLNTTFMLVPNAVEIQKDDLPLFVDGESQTSIMDSIFNTIDEAISKVDVRDSLKEHKDEYIYYKSDHHWTSLGAFYTYQAMMKQLNDQDISIDSYTIYPVSNSFQGTLSNKTGSFDIKDQIDIYVENDLCDYFLLDDSSQKKSRSMYVSDALDTNDQYTVFLGGNTGISHIKTNNGSSRHLLLIKDSYANTLTQFLISQYQSITIVDPRYYSEKIENLISRDFITDVMYVYNTNTFVQDTSLADVLE